MTGGYRSQGQGREKEGKYDYEGYSKRNLVVMEKLSILILVASPWIYTYDIIALPDTYTHIHKQEPVKLVKSESEPGYTNVHFVA